jgi:hypothetical protein
MKLSNSTVSPEERQDLTVFAWWVLDAGMDFVPMTTKGGSCSPTFTDELLFL